MLIFITYFAVFFHDETERMQPFITELEDLVRRTENSILDLCLGGVHGACAMREGRLEEAGNHFERALRVSLQFEDAGTKIFMVDGFTEVRFSEGRFDEAREILETQIEHMARSTPGRVDLLRAKLAIADLLIGNVTSARDSLAELVPLMAGFDAKMIAAVYTRLGQAEALLGDLEDAKAHLDQAMQIARDMAMPTMTVSALVQRGRVARTEGAIAESADLFHEGLQVAVDRRLRPLVAECIESLASLAVDADSDAEAARLFGAADAMRTAMGMLRPPIDIPAYEADIDTARARLGPDAFAEAYHAGQNLSDDDAIAYARRMRTERKRPSSGWASLTPTELQVVALAAQGLSNAEIGKKLFTSAGTAKTHLSHVYAKLGVANRAELAALAVRHGV
jgi:ATP/maltotriose-dependent transcriptional regulator MalT